MCGILGTLPASSEDQFKSALNLISHRGPDGYGIWTNEAHEISLGHRRLALLDLSERGAQPMHYKERYTITYNGEVYNFIEIRRELENKGFRFSTESDTEVIIAAYHHWGTDCFLKFNGMWALALWDHQEKKLLLSRDRFGQKPLFYAFVEGKFIFASEMKAITPFLKEIKPSNDFQWCANNVATYENTEKTLVDKIQRFPAGHFGYLNLTNLKINLKKYWNTLDHLVDVTDNYEEQVIEFRKLFIDACKLRMRADVSIGTALSGGVDSSAVVSTMAHFSKNDMKQERVAKDWQHAFVATFPGTFLDESYYAERVAKHIDIPATYVNINDLTSIENLKKYLGLFEELYYTSPVPMVEIYKAVKQHGVTVTLDGHGADELLSGYGHLPIAFKDCGVNLKHIKEIATTAKENSVFSDSKKVTTFEATKTYLGFQYQQIINQIKGRQVYTHHQQLGAFNSQLYHLFHESIMPTLLRNYDRYSMMHGVEIRMPFLDHRIVSFLFSISWKSKIKNGYTKAILRDAVRPFIDPQVINRKSKLGFSTPIVDWMKNNWKEFLLDSMNSQSFKTCNLINPKEVKSLVQGVIENPNATYYDGELAWDKLTPYLWQETFLKTYSTNNNRKFS